MTVQDLRVDLLVVGFGKGGKTLVAEMGRRGYRVAMVEHSDRMYGGTCINVGCVPTKALIHEAGRRGRGDDAADWYRHAVKSTDELTTILRSNNFRTLDALDSVTVITGHASFLDPHTVEVTAGQDRLVIRSDTIALNTGAEPVTRGLPVGGRILTSTELIATRELPERLAIVGGGHVGLEFAGMYARFGSQVTVLDEAAHILRHEDREIASAAADILREDGVTLIGGATVVDVHDGGRSAAVTYRSGGAENSMEADVVLVALGRAPVTRGLALDAAGVRTTQTGAIAVDQYLRTSQPHIFALGDVTGGPQFTYVSLDDSRIVLDQLVGSGRRSTADRTPLPYTLFLTPPLARVGLTEAQARSSGHSVRVASKPVAGFSASPRPRILGETRGVLKFVIDGDSDEILGAALLCADAQEMINLVALAMRHGVTASELRDTVYTHPSSTEAFTELLAELV